MYIIWNLKYFIFSKSEFVILVLFKNKYCEMIITIKKKKPNQDKQNNNKRSTKTKQNSINNLPKPESLRFMSKNKS